MSEWFVKLKGKKRGPFTVVELKQLDELTPDTLAWKEGMPKWLPIRDIPELKILFEDKEEPLPVDELMEKGVSPNDVVLTLPHAEPPLLFWLLFFILITIYVLFQFYAS